MEDVLSDKIILYLPRLCLITLMIIKLSQILFLDDFVYLVESIQKDNKEDQFGGADVETIFVIVKGQTLIEKDDIGKVKCTMKLF